MSVKLRWRTNKDQSKTAYLDIYDKGNRRKKFIDIRIHKSDTSKKEKKAKAEEIRTRYHNELLNRKFDLVSEEKLDSDLFKYFQKYIKTYKGAGIRKYRYAYEKFLSFLLHDGYLNSLNTKDEYLKIHIPKSHFKFTQLTETVCQNFKDYLYGPQSGLSGETPYDYFKRFKAVINKAFEERYLIKNPTNIVKISKPESNIKKEILTFEEIQALANTECYNSEIKRAFLFACFSGLGEAEIKKLKWKNISEDKYKIPRSKNQREIRNKISVSAKQLLGPKGDKEELIFNLPSDVTILKHLGNWVKKAGIEKHITFYCGRHSFAVLNLRENANLVTVSKLMGHASTSSTLKYLNYLQTEKDEAIDNLPQIKII